MAIDVPYHYEHAPRVVQNVRIESQNNWYLGAHRQATDIKPLNEAVQVETNKAKETAPTWDALPGKGDWQMKAATPAKKKPAAVKAKRKPTSPPMCTDASGPNDNCLPPK